MPKLAAERVNLVALMERTVIDQAAQYNWHYRAVRPQEIISDYTNGMRVEADCSDGCRDLCSVVGVKDDPAGTNYAPYGNSNSCWMHLHHIDIKDMQPGDLFSFGWYAGEKHLCMAYKKTANGWTVWNMGRPGQPEFKTLLQEISGHAGMKLTCLRLNIKDPPATHEDELRAMTGFYAWVAWRLGEGSTTWKPYGKANPKVRPNVPKVIPPVWWRDLARFLANRKRPNKQVKENS